MAQIGEEQEVWEVTPEPIVVPGKQPEPEPTQVPDHVPAEWSQPEVPA